MAVLGTDWVGRQIDSRLTLLEWLGSTSVGDVFRSHLPDGTPAALLLAQADDEHAAALLQNWQTAAALNHPHLLHVFEAARGQVDGCPVIYILTEMPEEALSQVLPERALTADEVREMLPAIIETLADLHAQGLVHGALEPANILVVGERLKLAPYSLQPAGSLPGRGERGRIYDAPETDDGPLTPAADVWSLGVLVIEALTQHAPTWVRSSGRDPLVPVDVPQPFARIAQRSLRFDPAQRCLLADIHAMLSNPAGVQAAEAAAVQPTRASAATEQLPLFDPADSGQATDEPRLRKSFRSIEDEDEGPRLRLPLPMILGAAALLLLFIVGIIAYSHRGRKAAVPGEQSTTAPAAAADQPAKSIKPLPEPSGPTVKGQVSQRVIPEIPARAARGIRGRVDVTVKLAVDHSGGVMNAAIVSDGHSRYFANQALDAARKWRFRAAKIHGQPAASTWHLRFIFTKSGTDVTPSEMTP